MEPVAPMPAETVPVERPKRFVVPKDVAPRPREDRPKLPVAPMDRWCSWGGQGTEGQARAEGQPAGILDAAVCDEMLGKAPRAVPPRLRPPGLAIVVCGTTDAC